MAFPCASLRESVPIPPPRPCPSPGCRAIARGNSIASMAPGPEIRMHHCLIIALARLTTRNLRPGSPFPLARGFVPRRRWLSIGEFDPEDTSSSGFARNDRSFGVSHLHTGRNRNALGARCSPAHPPSSELLRDGHDCSSGNSPTSARRTAPRIRAAVAGKPNDLRRNGKRLAAHCLFVSRDAAIPREFRRHKERPETLTTGQCLPQVISIQGCNSH